jgi:hypothetical protein
VAVPFEGDFDELLGEYSGPARGRHLTVTVSREGEALVFTPEGAEEGMKPVHTGDLTWVLGNTRLFFLRESQGINQLRMDQVSGHYVLMRSGG